MECQFCELSFDSKWKCKQCDLVLCDRCNANIHTKIPSSIKHEVEQVDVSTSESVHEGGKKVELRCVPCSEHKEQNCVIYCRHCDKSLCSSCIIQPHQNDELQQMCEDKKTKLAELNDQIGEVLPFFTEKATEFREINSKTLSAYNEIKDEIHERKTQLKNLITKRATKLVSDLDKIWNPEDNTLTAETNRLTQTEGDLKQRKILLEETLETQHPVSFLKAFDSLDMSVPLQSVRDVITPDFKFVKADAFDGVSFLGSVVKVPKLILKHSFDLDFSAAGIVSINKDIFLIYDMDGRNFKQFIISESKLVATSQIEDSTYTLSKYDNQFLDVAVCHSQVLILDTNERSYVQVVKKNNVKKKIGSDLLVTLHCLYATSDEIVLGYRDSSNGGIMILTVQFAEKKRFQCNDSLPEKLFTYPGKLTKNINGDFCILDYKNDNYYKTYGSKQGRVMVLGSWGQPKWTYCGHPSINTNDKFAPFDLVATPSGLIFVAERDTNAIHVLSMTGQFLTNCSVEGVIVKPVGLNIDGKGDLQVLCEEKPVRFARNTSKLHVAKLM